MERHPYANTGRDNFNKKGRFDIHNYLNNQVRAPGDDAGDFRVSGPTTAYGTTASRGGAKGTEFTVGFEDTIIHLDSAHADADSSPITGELLWLISPINSNRDITNCMAISITPFKFPYLWSTAFTAASVPIMVNSRVYIRIVGLPFTQAASGFGDLQYHFECAITDVTNITVTLVPLRETFFLQRPITSLSELRVRFYIPPIVNNPPTYLPIRLPEYVARVQIVTPGLNPLAFRIIDPPSVVPPNSPLYRNTSILGPPAPVAEPIPVQFRGIVTNIPLFDVFINSPEGFFVTDIGANFSILVDGTAITASNVGFMYIQKNRILMPMRFTSVADGPTNYIHVNHV